MAIKSVGTAASGATDLVTVGYIAALKYSAVIGDGSTLSYTVTHNFNSQLLTLSTFSSESTPPTVTSATLPTMNTAVIVFDRAPTASSVQVVIRN